MVAECKMEGVINVIGGSSSFANAKTKTRLHNALLDAFLSTFTFSFHVSSSSATISSASSAHEYVEHAYCREDASAGSRVESIRGLRLGYRPHAVCLPHSSAVITALDIFRMAKSRLICYVPSIAYFAWC